MKPTRPSQVRTGRGGHLPPGHVTTQQLKADLARGIDYFYSRRPNLHRPVSLPFIFSRKYNRV